jgi:hypothetical protein
LTLFKVQALDGGAKKTGKGKEGSDLGTPERNKA